MELLFIRHALPMHVDNTATGKVADPPLSDLGRRQAWILANWLAGTLPGGPPKEDINAIYSSPLTRALETADPLSKILDCQVNVDIGFAEYDAQETEYIPLEALKASKDPRWVELISEKAIPDMATFQKKVTNSVEKIIIRHPGQRVVIVCHGGVIGAYLAHILNIGRILFFEAKYTSINRVLAATTGERTISSINELAHLQVSQVPLYKN
tara:strand:+ start:303 stop:935 length:633 start_codon:yes stop_codon:yes gene_type:complete